MPNRSSEIWPFAVMLVSVAAIVGTGADRTFIAAAVSAKDASDWLGFAGAILGAAATIIAGALAWIAAVRTIEDNKRQAAVDRLLTSRTAFMRLNALRAIAVDAIDHNPPDHPGLAAVKNAVVECAMSLEVISAGNDPLLRSEEQAIGLFDVCSRLSIMTQDGIEVSTARSRVVAENLFFEIDGAILKKLQLIDAGEELSAVAKHHFVDLTQYRKHIEDGTVVDTTHIKPAMTRVDIRPTPTHHSAASR